MVDVISKLVMRSGDNTLQVGRQDKGEDAIKAFTEEDLEIWNARIIRKSRDVSNDTIWGLFEWNNSNWDNTYTNDMEIISVLNAHNYYPEQFSNDRFIDSDLSTGSLYNNYYELDVSEQFHSTYITKNNTRYSKAKIELLARDSSNNIVTDNIEIMAYIGNNYFKLTNNEYTDLVSDSTDGMKILIKNKGTEKINLNYFYVNYVPTTEASTYDDDTIYLYTEDFTNLATWEVSHNFDSYNTIIQVYDNMNCLLMASIKANDTNKYTIDFGGDNYTGKAIVHNISFLKNKIYYVTATEQILEHNLNDSYPIIQVYDKDDNVMMVDEIEILTADKVKITTTDNCKVIIHSAKSSQRYVQNFSGNSSYTITHNLDNAYPIIQVWENNKKIIPDTIHIVNNNQIELIFDDIVSGTVVIHVGER